MEKVFSRWPSHAPTTLAQAGSPDTALPGWMLASSQSPRPNPVRDTAIVFSVMAVLAAIMIFLIKPVATQDGLIASLAAAIAGVAVAFAVVRTALLKKALAQSNARYEAIFERAGISMYLEDWSAAGRAVMSLRQSGVQDMEAHFATRPDELRALCAQVMIKNVNTFTVEETGAPGKEALIGSLDRLLPATDQTFVQWLVAFAKGDRFFRSEAHITRPDGSEGDSLFTAALPGNLDGFADIIVSSLDITDYKIEQSKLRDAESKIARASRISTVGALSASIAHEVNSPLAAIVANAQAALRWLQRPVPDIDEAIEAVSAIVADATRAKEVVMRTRAFAGTGAVSMGSFDLVLAAREANLLVEREIRNSGAIVHIEAEPGLPKVKGDVIQTQQIITNLLLNAAQAMNGQTEAKDITISFTNIDGAIRVDITDCGPGIEPRQLERVFDPFYTTRSEGMGMGLAICRNCVDAQGGIIWATSRPGHGATIHFTLPKHDD